MTLMEVMIVVIILAILAAFALPQYQRTMDQARLRQAEDMLQTIRAAEIVYWSRNNHYLAPTTWDQLLMDPPGGNGVTYAISSVAGQGTAATFTATAQDPNGQTKILNEKNEWSGTWN